MSPSTAKKKRTRTYQYNENFAFEFGLQVVTGRNDKKGVVESAVCRFCECWGREESSADFTIGAGNNADGPASGQKRKLTINCKHFNLVFRSDIIRKHLKEQHPIKFKEYSALRSLSTMLTEEVMTTFFLQSTLKGIL